MVQTDLARNHKGQGTLSPPHANSAQPERCSGFLASSQILDSTDSSIGRFPRFRARVARAIEGMQNGQKNNLGRVVSRAGYEFRVPNSGNEPSLNKLLNRTALQQHIASRCYVLLPGSLNYATLRFVSRLQRR